MLSSSSSVTTLKLNGCGLGDDGAIAIARGAYDPAEAFTCLPAFVIVIIRCAGMVSNKQVSTLEMGLNAIGDRSAKSIANMLLQNDTLRGLSLFKNSMLTAGIRVSDFVYE